MKRLICLLYSYRVLPVCAVLVFCCVLTTACKQPKPLTVTGVGKVRMMPMKQPPFLVNVQFYNPNGYTIQMKHADVEVFVNNTHLGQMRLDTLIKAPAHANFDLPVGLNIDLVSILPNIGELLFKPTIHIKLDGSIKVGYKGVFKKIPLHYEGDQVPDKLEMKLMDGFK